MANPSHPVSLEEQIEQWRSYLRRRPDGHAVELAELEGLLRGEIAVLTQSGLVTDEAFLVAVNRLGRRNAVAGEFAREYSDRAWQQFVAPAEAGERRAQARKEGIVAFSLATAAALAIKAPALFGRPMDNAHEGFYLRNASLLVLPCLIGFFVWKRRLALRTVGWLALAFAVAAVFANLPGFGGAAAYEPLTALHLPIALLLAVGVAHAGGRWREVSGRMDFIRFSGELFIYYVLIALGGGVLIGFVAMFSQMMKIDPEQIIGRWLVPCGAAGAVIVASWLVEAKRGMMENMAPMLTRLFTPMFAVMLIAFLGTLVVSGRGIAIDRELLIGFDLLLVVVLGLLLYSIAARNPSAPPGAFDVAQVVLVVAALLADAVALWAIGARISEFGPTPNRIAALGENVILLVNLAGSAVLYLRFVLGRGSFSSLERWQTGYIPVYAAWGAIVVIAFPPLFRALQ